jgi:hypothetical protein
VGWENGTDKRVPKRRTRGVLEENGQVSMVLEIGCFHGIGAFKVYRLKVSALKLSHPPVCSVLRLFGPFPNSDTASRSEGDDGDREVNGF